MFVSRLASSSSLPSITQCLANFGKQRQQQHRFMSVIDINDQEASEKFIRTNEKAILYFTATWCPPCKMIKPVYKSLSEKYPNVSFGKIDIDDNHDSAMKHKISSVPTFVFFNGEEKYKQFSGANREQLKEVIEDFNKL
mmetsp:Transcript_38568/g.43047  ORF Transcript_38568/g.43047 Transcript_38568/m.43047 type:complete len:139 (+) Transcript_38568:64-480(+)